MASPGDPDYGFAGRRKADPYASFPPRYGAPRARALNQLADDGEFLEHILAVGRLGKDVGVIVAGVVLVLVAPGFPEIAGGNIVDNTFIGYIHGLSILAVVLAEFLV